MKTGNRKSTCGRLAALFTASAALALAADAASITIDAVRQQLLWSNNVDVTFTVADGDGCFDARVGRVRIKSVVNGVEYIAYDGISGPGQHTVTWANPPKGVKCDDCKMYAELFLSDPVPSGDDYMVVDLVTGAVTYEGLFAPNAKFASYTGQQLSNARYNTDKYKTTHMVLRKVPKGTYKAKRGTGAFKSWTTDRDYYIGIFCLTTAQYGHVIKRTNGKDATAWSDYSLKSRRWTPYQIRGNTVPSGNIATYPGADAAIDARKWRPLELLNAKTGMNFDVPTELMLEIACRAGTESTYFWGNDASLAPQYAVYGIRGRAIDSQYADPPGTRKPNGWGLYDMVGNEWQWCRTYVGEGEPPDVFTPGKGSSDRWYVRGENIYTADPRRLSCDVRSSASTSSGVGYSFRAAYVVPNGDKGSQPQLYMAGDSIMADYGSDMFPQYGWGQALRPFMKEPSRLHNLARSGWSARRFRESGRWEDGIASKLKPGDWVIVSFGHNDMNKRRNKAPKNDYSTPAEYKAFLAGFAADARAKGANVAFATPIAHSSGFSEAGGAMRVDGGATGLGTYVAAMREVAAECGAPVLDLNKYAVENLPKLGLAEAKSLYMFVGPGEYPNYPAGKQDAAHVRDGGAFFYAKAAVEMARSQGLAIADFWKDPAGVPFVPSVAPARAAQGLSFSAVSPDGANELRLDVGQGEMRYSILRRGKAIVEPTWISLVTREHGRMDGSGAAPKSTSRKVEGRLATPIYKKASVDLSANETLVDFGEWALRLHARNDGVAWRFETKYDGEITVAAENTNVRFPKGATLCYSQEGGFQSGWEKPAKTGPVKSVKPGHPQIVMTPFTATVPGAGVFSVTESNLLDYPGLNFFRRDDEPDMLRSWQAGVPSRADVGRRMTNVLNRHNYLAKTKGTRVFPWRVFVIGDSPSDLVSSDAVYALAEPSRIADASWVKAGQVAWDWWNGFRITDVPGLDTGCNFETYKEYANFAAANGIAYIIMDEGWAEKLDLDKPRDDVNVPGVIAYAKEKGVDVILWAAWAQLMDRERRLRVFDRYAAMGAKGFKIDFMNRDDQLLERFLEETAADAAERKLVVMYHGIHKPTGLCRTYPNVLNYEGVYGLEQGHSIGGRKVVVSNDVNLVYTRMVAGAMDYTPGAMRNRAFGAPDFVKGRDAPACYGTRCHQLALFPLFEAPVQMLCDSPTQYRTAPECTAFLTKVPTVWDETKGVAGEIGAYASVARRKGRDWWLGAITNWEGRGLDLPTTFLGEGEWTVEAFEDADDADTNAEHYVRRTFKIKAGDPLRVKLAPGGGFAARLAPCAGNM